METRRRSFVRWVGTAAAGVLMLTAGAARADRIRVLRPVGPGAEGPGGGGQVSPEFQRFVRGIRVGESRSYGAVRVFWLYAEPSRTLPIATLEEARERGDLLITERDQATVPELVVENRGKGYVLLLAGEILLGGKQNRVLIEDILLPPHSGPRPIGVYCVEAGRWTGRSAAFESKGSFAAPGLRSKAMAREGQGRVWAEVDRYARAAEAASPTQSYQALYDKPEIRAQLDDAARQLDHRAAPGTVGAAVFVGGALTGLDLFVDPGLFAHEWPKLSRAQILEVYGRSATADGDEGAMRRAVAELLRAAAAAGGTLRSNAGVGRLFDYRAGGRRGSALIFEGAVIHAALL